MGGALGLTVSVLLLSSPLYVTWSRRTSHNRYVYLTQLPRSAHHRYR